MSRARTLRIVAVAAAVAACAAGPPLAAAGAATPTQAKPATSSQARPQTSQQKTSQRQTTTSASSKAARARRTRLARARAAARARQMREAAIPRFKSGPNGELVPDVRAAAAIIYNAQTDEVLWEERSQDLRSIASITKVMTASVVLEQVSDLDQEVLVTRGDLRGASTTYLRANEWVSVDDLLHLLLLASDNAAARVLARTSVWGSEGFVIRMNEKALELGLAQTSFADSSGLDPANVSSAYDMARLIAFAAGDDRLPAIMQKPEWRVRTSRRTVRIQSTYKPLLPLLDGRADVRVGKTGFIRQAGYCLATLLQLPQGPQVAVVILGARSGFGRLQETKHLVNWILGRAHELVAKDSPGQSQPQPQP